MGEPSDPLGIRQAMLVLAEVRIQFADYVWHQEGAILTMMKRER